MKVFLKCALVLATVFAPLATANSEEGEYEGNKGIALLGPGAKADEKRDAVMNDIRFSDYEGFEKKFKLVTVTYRTDVKEMRFSYANDLAFETLRQNSINYPDGASFVKVSVRTLGDPAFLNSEVPAGSHRYQIMLKDHKKYADTDGWGYASFAATDWGYEIFGWDGNIARDNLENISQRCHACHTVVKERGYIFSRIANVNPAPGERVTAFGDRDVINPDQQNIEFITIKREEVPKKLQKFLPKPFAEVRRIQGALSRYAYLGNAFEMRMMFIKEAMQSKKPVLFYRDDGGSILIVAPTDKKNEPHSPTCKPNQQLLVSYWTIGGSMGGWPSKDLFCYSAVDVPQLEEGPALPAAMPKY